MDELIEHLKRSGVLRAPHTEAAFRAIDRKDFVPPEYISESYEDHPLPIGRGQTISQPYTVAFMLDLLQPQPGEKILDIGAGSGWQTALLARIAGEDKNGHVYAVERVPELCRMAEKNIAKYGFIERGIVKFFCGDAAEGLEEHAPFDKIVAAASAVKIPDAWKRQLKTGGILVAPVGNSIFRCRKTGEQKWEKEEFPGFAFVPLIQRPKNSGGKPKGRILPLLALFLAFIAGGYLLLAPKAVPPEARAIEIAPGMGSEDIGDYLRSRKIIRSKWIFLGYSFLTGQAGDLKPGAYELNGRIGIPSLVKMLREGEAYPNERFITIPEGWDLRDIGAYLEKNGVIFADDLYRLTGEPAKSYPKTRRFPPEGSSLVLPKIIAAKPNAAILLEGYLYPDTYRVFRNAAAEDIVSKLLENFDRKITPELREEMLKQKKSIHDVITMASLVEKEVSHANERRIAAGILWKRLSLGIPLQVDATVNYITGKHETPSAADLRIDSPYNTYRYSGLPPTPIANPGMDAIMAAAYPESTGYRYYLSTPEGKTIFSRTFEEHIAAKTKYLR